MSVSGETVAGQLSTVPGHVAIIMDGNGRWAQKRGLRRFKGHEEGEKAVREIVRCCGEYRVRELTLYAFSTENWRRPKREVDYLMRLLRKYLINERRELIEKDVRLKAIGRLHLLPESVRSALDETIKISQNHSGLILRLALNYGGRQEMLDAFTRIAEKIQKREIAPDQVDEDLLRRHLYDNEMTDPDLIIRTGGEMRASNFLLWQLSYAEFWFTEVYWPDFRRTHLEKAFADYSRRQRRFGGIPAASGKTS